MSIDPNDFQEEFERPVYTFIIEYYQKHKALPQADLIRKKFSLDEPLSGELTFWFDEFLKRKFLIHYDQHLTRINPLVAKGDLESAKRELQAMTIAMSRIGYEESPILTRQQLTQSILDKIPQRRVTGGVTGIPTRWAGLNRMLHGWMGGNVYAIAGRKKLGKTQALMLCAEASYDFGADTFVLSMEMTTEEFGNRVVSVARDIGQNFLITGRISTPMQRLLQKQEKTIQETPFYKFKEGFFNATTAEIEHIVIMEKPKILFIDGAYLVKASGANLKMAGWERVAETIKELKLIAGKHNIPIVCTYQFNKEGEIHLSDAIAQIATAVIGVYEPNNQPGTRVLRVIDNRNGGRGDVLIAFDFNTVDFHELECSEESGQLMFIEEDVTPDE